MEKLFYAELLKIILVLQILYCTLQVDITRHQVKFILGICLGDEHGFRVCKSKSKPLHFVKVSSGHKVRAQAATNADSRGIEIPKHWYNIIADLSVKPAPPLNPRTFEPVKPEDLAPLFPEELIKQEVSSERFIEIPEEVLDVYSLWRPTPLIRF